MSSLKITGICAAKDCCQPAISTLGFCMECVDRVRSCYDHAETAENFFRNFMAFSTFIYFVYAPSAQAVKIGQSKRIENRLKALQTGMAGNVELLTCMRARPSMEKYAHDYFSASRINNEWFSLSKPIVAMLVQIADGKKPELLQHGSINLESSAKNYGLWLCAKLNGSEVWEFNNG